MGGKTKKKKKKKEERKRSDLVLKTYFENHNWQI
jgi:hypothetical protein